MRVFIAEKPSLAAAIFEGLGGNTKTDRKDGYYQKGSDVVTWCVGHLLQIDEPTEKWELGALPIVSNYPPKMIPIARTKSQLMTVANLVKQATSLVNAGDPDEEGNLLVDEVITYCNASHKPTKRLLIADLNPQPVKDALANMQDAEKFKTWTLSAMARAIGDQLYGFNMTRVYTLMAQELGYRGVLSIGRVQTVCLGMINERTLANQNHKASFIYSVMANIAVNNQLVKARFIPTDSNNIDDQGRLTDATEAKNIAELLKGKQGKIIKAETKESKAQPTRPYNLSSIQQLCAKKFGYSAEKTLGIIQSLYETHKLVTYPRTDNRFLGDAHYADRGTIFEAIVGTIPELRDSIAGTDSRLKHACFDQKKIEAHHALCPTLKSGAGITLSKDEINVYKLIAVSYIALFYPPSVREKTSIVFDIDSMKLGASQTVVTESGWESLYKGDIAEEAKLDSDLTNLSVGMDSLVKATGVGQGKTKPPKYHVESSLLGSMAKAGKLIKDPVLRKDFEAKDKGDRDQCGSIGTEATRASILAKIKERTDLVKLVKVKGYKEETWQTTKRGQEFCAMLPPEFLAPDISAVWSQKQELIRNGEMSVPEFLHDLDSFIAFHVDRVKTDGVKITVETKPCTECGGTMTKRSGAKGDWWGCNNYPECKHTQVAKSGTKGKGKAKGVRKFKRKV
ncbi:DNA topoisomerase (plasmid) [Vibrio parahaemolyticus]|uniref:DNA topoisomerase n=1 Tax=Vibrio harveyi group TaxID=717610 RepID=UPI000971964A|nr:MULTISPECIES: DNA topoisomerase [Vibrio harveyi group]APX10021.1 DNA topoisomerase III [Vibrio campbellii]APX10129.1 DNA topoisomerase III [Vibrio campbellii]ARR10582.1 DNA topoisomerase III [Vibrio campbellii]WCP78894.1 DNA topoisomerase [Vibrio parahaemolyticus]WHP52910.1 DNA topoisomerase [Vibrio parahaemolyticus]